MSEDINRSSHRDRETSMDIIDLCAPCDKQSNLNLSPTNHVVVVTPHRPTKYNYIDDITKAISSPSYSAIYTDESSIPDVKVIEDVNTVTPNKYSTIPTFDLPNENETDESTSQSLSQYSKLSSLITKN